MTTYPVLIGIILLVLSSMIVGYSWAATAPAFSTQWGSYGLQNTGQFAFPQGVATDSSGNVYVTDLGNRRVEKFDNNGNFLFTFGTKGSDNGQFNSPLGIAISGNNIYVVDDVRNDIQKFDLTGKFITKWGGAKGSEHGQFLLPQSVAVDPSGDVYVVDTGNSRVEKFDTNGKYLLTIGGSGLDDGKFLSPHVVFADSQGSIYVSDSGNNRIEKFTQDGVFLASYGVSNGASLKNPLGLVVDKSGNIFVVDNGNNRIVELDGNGHVVTTWGSQGTGADFFDNPRSIALDPAGNVFVVDTSNNRIQKFGSSSLETPMLVQPQTANQTQITPPPQTINQTQDQNTSPQEQQVIVNQNPTPPTIKITAPNDHTPPSITAPADMTVEATGILTPVSVGQATATDESGIALISSNAPQRFPLGITMITWTAIDNGGNVAKVIQKITVVDTTPPVFTAPPNVTIEAKSSGHNILDLGLPSVNDAVAVESVTNDAPPYFPIGKTTVTWKALDSSGNAATATQVVTVQDTTPPVIHAPSDITQEATSAASNLVNLGNATATDNGIVESVTNDAPSAFPLGKTTVTWTATDESGNKASATQVVTIIDTTAPKISPPANIVFEATSINQNNVPLGNATVSDNGIIKTITNNATQFFSLGKTTILWIATDESGNKANATQIVTVKDTTAPKLTPPHDVQVQATSLHANSVELGNATATDIQPVTITSNATKTFPLGKTIVLWTAKDASGNTSNATQVIDLINAIPPKLTPPSNVVVEATSLDNNTIQLGNPTVVDLESVTITNDAPKEFPLGVTTITWYATDVSGNKANATQTVTVKDTTSPKLTIPSDLSVKATSLDNNVVPIGNATATDNVKVVSITNNASKTFPLGKTSVLWIATDESGNKANATQIVNVENTTPPKLTIPSNVTFEATSLDNNVVPIGNVTATDIQPVTITNNAPKEFPLGKTSVLWIATDESGNKANATQVIDVVDTIAPKLTIPSNVTFEATSLDNNVVPIGNATATDIQPVTITSNATKTFPLGKTIVLWTAKDASGNTSNATQVIDVVDTIAPKLTIPSNVTFEATSLNNNTVPLGKPIATDIQPVTITNNAPKEFSLGLTTVTWTAEDSSGNISNGTQTVLVKNTTPPKLTIPSNVTFEATSLDDNVVPIGNATATDIQPVTITSNATKTFPLGKTIVLWTAKDASGNTSNATQVIDVVDTIAPKLTIPSNVTFEATSLDNNVVPIGNATATDIQPVTITSNATKTFPLGKTIVLWTAKDASGNTSNATQVIDVVDTIAPKLTIPSNVTFEATSLDNNVVPIGNATATDIQPVTITNNAPKEFPLGKTSVLWIATDESGNKANATQIVTVKDTTAPIIHIPSNVTFEATSLDNNVVPIGNATATDIQPITITSNAAKTFPLGKTIVLWTAKDASGNTSNATQVIDVVDTIAPTIVAPHNVIVNATSSVGTPVNIGNATVADGVKVSSLTNNAPFLFPFGNTTVVWTVKDESGNMANSTQTIEVVDKSPPQLTIPQDVVTDAKAFVTPLVVGQATATGIMDTTPTITNNSTGIFHIGKTIIQWIATDKFGNKKTLDQTVTILACGKPSSSYNLIMGTNDTEVLTGSAVPNLIIGLEGNDIIHEGPSGDCVIAGNGNNIIYAGNGTNTIYAGNGDNIIKGGTGNMNVIVGDGSNIIQGGSGQNTCYLGYPAKDTVVNCQIKH